MPPTSSTLRVGRYLLSLLLIFVVLYGLVFWPGRDHKPKLGLDLVGGAQLVLKARSENGKAPTDAQMRVALEILTARVNGSGVSAAEVVKEGTDRIVISVPGKTADAQAKLKAIGTPAVLNFRPLVMPAQAAASAAPAVTTSATASATATGAQSTGTPATSTAKTTTATTPATKATTAAANAVQPRNIIGTTAPATTAAKTSATPSAAATTSAAPVQNPFTKANGINFTLPTTDTAFQALTSVQKQFLQLALDKFKCGSKPADVATAPLAACNAGGTVKYLLGPVIVAGREISSATAVAPSTNSLQWTVAIDLKSSGQTKWAEYTAAHHSDTTSADASSCSTTTTPCAEFVAFTLDGDAISTPHNQATINGTTSVSGSFTSTSANELADQLKYGALPLSFDQESVLNISATLGSSQLQAGLLAGAIGLILVILYSLVYYRGLGLVTIASLIVSGGLTWAMLVILGREIGFTLTLSGIAGFIVAVGITADSFVVFFERVKDEVHEGRSFRVAVPRAWSRARRTIISADFVSLLAAATLYYFAAGEVRGFAFTLGLSTVLDLVVVFLFTHPLVSLLSRSRAFGSPRFTGLNSVRGSTPVLPDAPPPSPRRDKRPARPARGGVALLEPDTEPSTDTDGELDADAVERELASMSTTEPEPVSASRSRGPVGVSAAERAAARRGRAMREPVVTSDDADADADVDDADVDDDSETVEVAPSRGRLRGRAARRAARQTAIETDDDVLDDGDVEDSDVEDSDVETDADQLAEAEADEVEGPPEDATPGFATPPSRSGATAADRAAARRRRVRERDASPTPPAIYSADLEQSALAEAEANEIEGSPEDDVTVGTVGLADPEPVPDAPMSSAAARAAARRGRIRGRASAPADGSAAASDPVAEAEPEESEHVESELAEMEADQIEGPPDDVVERESAVELSPAAARAAARRARIRTKAVEEDS